MEYAIKIPNEKRFNEVVKLAKKLGYSWFFNGGVAMHYVPEAEVLVLDNASKDITWTDISYFDHINGLGKNKLSYKQLKALVEVKL